ncbi:MAG TPA: hypothetical protein VFE45_17310 [Coriobacteriia bacterium]|nr:hypothetical protein [Coriobacteriia bacterium]
MCARRFTLEYYRTADGDQPVRRWIRHDEQTILKKAGLATLAETPRANVLLRVFCHATGDRVILLLGGYDKGSDASPRRQEREIALARRRLGDYRRRHS